MAFTNDFDAPDSPPPPAYELTEQEYDLKTSHVLETSQSEPQRYAGGEEEEWEMWDETVFATNASHLTLQDNQQAGSSSRSPIDASASSASQSIPGYAAGSSSASPPSGSGIQPLRIVKKNQSTPSAKQKERPNWYAEAQLDNGDPTRTSVQQNMPTNPPRSAYVPREPTPPPMFTAVADEPPYEPPPIVMTYQPGDSRPASPLESPPQPAAPLYYPPPPPSMDSPPSPTNSLRRLPRPPPPPIQSAPAVPTASSLAPSPPPLRPQHQSMMPPARPAPPRVSPRPTTTYQPRPPPVSSFGPRVAFDPRVAYANMDKKSGEEPPVPTNINASAFYSSSVASHYNVPPRRPPPPPSNMYGGATPSQTYATPQSQPAAMGGYYGGERAKSPTPSAFSSHSGQGYQQQGYAQPGYGQGAYQQPAYQGGGYQPNTHQPTSYQPTTYQSTAYANSRTNWAPQQLNNGYGSRPW